MLGIGLYITGAANTAAPNLIKILTLFSLRLHQYYWWNRVSRTNSIGATDFADFLHVSSSSTNTLGQLVAPKYWSYKEKRSVSSTITYRPITA